MKVFQKCPHCGRDEAAGRYCTGCLEITQPDWLYTKLAPNDALARHRATSKREKGLA